MLTMENTNYGEANNLENRPALSNALWLQYVLDNFKTVEEVLASLEQYQIIESRIGENEIAGHLAIQDKTGDSALIEFVNGVPVVYHCSGYNVMTNEGALLNQFLALPNYKPFGGERGIPGEVDATSRFVRAATYMQTLPQPSNGTEAVNSLESVIRTTMVPHGAESKPTRWVATADLTNQIYYFKSTNNQGGIWVDLKKLKLNQANTVKTLDPTQGNLSGDVAKQFKSVKPAI